MTIDNIKEMLEKSEYGIISINEESEWLNHICNTNYSNHVLMSFSDKTCKDIAIFKVDYKDLDISNTDRIRTRQKTIDYIFAIWNILGFNKHKAKDPFRSKAFVHFFQSLVSTQSTVYVVIDNKREI